MKTKKVVALLLCTLLALGLLAGCGSPALPEGMDADNLEAQAKAAADLIVARDYAGFLALFPEEGQASTTPEQLAAHYDPQLDALGAFEKLAMETGPYKDAEGTEYGVVLVEQTFAGGKMNHTATFTTDSQLIGFIQTA